MSKKEEIKIKFLRKVFLKKIIIKILYIFIILCVIYNIIFLVNTIIKKTDYFNLLGISLFSMETNLMEPEITKDSLVITREYNSYDEIEINDNIAYIVNGKIRINKVLDIENEAGSGKIVYKTKSNNNYFIDKEKITSNQVIGKVINNIPVLGILLKILQSRITTIFIIILLIIKIIYNKKMKKRKIKKIINETKGDTQFLSQKNE